MRALLLTGTTLLLGACSLVFADPDLQAEPQELSSAVVACSDHYLDLQEVLDCPGLTGSAVAPCGALDDGCDYTEYFECLQGRVSCDEGALEFDSPTSCRLPCQAQPSSSRQACDDYSELDGALRCNRWTVDECQYLPNVSCDLTEYFGCMEAFATCDPEVHARCASLSSCADGLETLQACQDFQRRARRLPCGDQAFFGTCATSLQSCETVEYYRCLEQRTTCNQGFLSVDPFNSCGVLQNCENRGNGRARDSCLRYRSRVDSCARLPFEDFICDSTLFQQCDLADFFSCLSENVVCTEEGPRTLYEGCAALTRCPAGARTVGACMRAADAVDSACDRGPGESTIRFECLQQGNNGCDLSPFYECVESRLDCFGTPNECFPLLACP